MFIGCMRYPHNVPTELKRYITPFSINIPSLPNQRQMPNQEINGMNAI